MYTGPEYFLGYKLAEVWEYAMFWDGTHAQLYINEAAGLLGSHIHT